MLLLSRYAAGHAKAIMVCFCKFQSFFWLRVWSLGAAQVLDCAGKHQVLIFVHSRKETAKTARYLKEEALREDKLASFMRVSVSRGPPQLLNGRFAANRVQYAA